MRARIVVMLLCIELRRDWVCCVGFRLLLMASPANRDHQNLYTRGHMTACACVNGSSIALLYAY